MRRLTIRDEKVNNKRREGRLTIRDEKVNNKRWEG